MKRILHLFSVAVLLAMGAFSSLSAQDRTVTGRVTGSEDGGPLPGLNVLVKGTTNGTTTDAEGRYSISVSPNATLVFSFIGLETQEVAVGNRSTIDVQMESDVTSLSEVVVVGYGTQERKNLTGSVASVQGAELANLATPSFDQQLAGRAAGVQVTVPSGVLGQAPRIRIRGTNSISSGANPLVVVDGVPIITGNQSVSTVNNPLGDINPADIESLEVLKDGSATAIYGSRAANGVILITTKRGKQGKARVSYDGWIGYATPANRFDLLNAQEFIDVNNEKLVNAGEDPAAFPMQNPDGSIVDTDWQAEIFRTGFQHNHALSISGATEQTNYFFSLGWTDQEGFVISNRMKRASFRANVNQKITNWLSVGTNMGLTRTNNVGLNTGSNSLSGNVTSAASLFPNVPVRNPDGTFNISPDNVRLGQGENLLPMAYNYPNIAFVLANNKNDATNYRILGNAYAEATVTNGLTLRTQLGIDAFLNDDYIYWDPRHGDGRGQNGYVFQSFAPVLRWNWQNTVNYSRVIAENHNINFVAGMEFQKETSRYYQAQASDLADPFFGQNNIVSNTFSTPNVDGGLSQNGFESYFGRINYAFKDRYLLSFTVRNDAISALPAANRRGTFPGGSIGWRVSEEPFFQGLKEYVSGLKLRASYAVVGNVDIGDFPYAGTYASAQYGSQNGISFASVSNPDLRWESSKKLDFGVDISLFNDRINATVDYYRNNADDLILFTPTAFSVGIPGNTTIGTAYNGINQNVGSLYNTGVEIDVTALVIEKGGFTWTVNTNFATNRNEITALNNNEDIVNTYNITRVGESIGAIYGFTYAGVNAANGNPLYVKGNGQIIQGNIANNGYYVYNPENPTDLSEAATLSATQDRSVLGVTNPRWFGGVTNSFAYKGFDFNVFARFSGGNMIMNVTKQNQLRMEFQNNNAELLGRWQSAENPGDGQTPKLEFGNSNFINQEGFALSRFVEKGDFLRIQNITLGYSLPKNLIRKASLSNVRVFAQVQNAFTFTGYSGLDPEINLNSDGGTLATRSRANNQFGIDFNGNPPARVFTFGLNLGL